MPDKSMENSMKIIISSFEPFPWYIYILFNMLKVNVQCAFLAVANHAPNPLPHVEICMDNPVLEAG